MGTSSRFGPKNCGGGGEIVEVQGGHIIRSIGRKDRHSKVCTAKGPRDRRVRLAAHTAIQFYDVQDRLGYDRPSKAVDWLIKKAKASIDELAELPPWKPTIGPTTNNTFDQEKIRKQHQQQEEENVGIHCEEDTRLVNDNSNNVAGSSSSFLPPSLDSDAISDTIKSFFPMGGGSTEGNSSAMQFQSFQEHNLLSRTSTQSQDLNLSLQSFQDPILLHHQNPQSQHHNHHSEQAQTHFFTGSTPLIGFDASGWPEQLFGQNQFLSQRGPLQSSYSPSIRAWLDPSAIAIATADPIHHHQYHQAVLPMYSGSISGPGFASEVGGFSGFRIPARIQGDIEEHDGISDKPSSASSDSRH